ncbi:hypothetical protein OESDEN_15007 [Oesophagostomum dentatum]|uniref:Uncharacterized protein n=1 Tax=Oesophagostomum dentatum TaxID=61180 RepID=A0A0B1SQ03_OESDE|nr:hypothetical protein OESDEN_15007 [Oesophagostomum dentatum]
MSYYPNQYPAGYPAYSPYGQHVAPPAYVHAPPPQVVCQPPTICEVRASDRQSDNHKLFTFPS